MISYTEWFRMASLPWDHPESMYHQRYHRSINRIAFWLIYALVCAIVAEVGGAWYYALAVPAITGIAIGLLAAAFLLYLAFHPVATGLIKYFKGELS